MRRLFWVALGATAGVLVFRSLSRTAAAYTPQGVSRSLSSAVTSVRELADVIREAMDEREDELRQALTADAGPPDNSGAAARNR